MLRCLLLTAGEDNLASQPILNFAPERTAVCAPPLSSRRLRLVAPSGPSHNRQHHGARSYWRLQLPLSVWCWGSLVRRLAMNVSSPCQVLAGWPFMWLGQNHSVLEGLPSSLGNFCDGDGADGMTLVSRLRRFWWPLCMSSVVQYQGLARMYMAMVSVSRWFAILAEGLVEGERHSKRTDGAGRSLRPRGSTSTQ